MRILLRFIFNMAVLVIAAMALALPIEGAIEQAFRYEVYYWPLVVLIMAIVLTFVFALGYTRYLDRPLKNSRDAEGKTNE